MKKIIVLFLLGTILYSCKKEKINEYQSSQYISFSSNVGFENLSLKEISTEESQIIQTDCVEQYLINYNVYYVIINNSIDTIGMFKVNENNELSLRGYPSHQLTFGNCSNLSIKIIY